MDLRLGTAATAMDAARADRHSADGSDGWATTSSCWPPVARPRRLPPARRGPRRRALPAHHRGQRRHQGRLRRRRDGRHRRRRLDRAGDRSRRPRGRTWTSPSSSTAELPLLRVLGPEAAPIFADLHRDHGVDLRCALPSPNSAGRNGAVTGVLLSDGSRIDADLVLVGVGVTPNIELAAEAGLHVDNGIVVDEPSAPRTRNLRRRRHRQRLPSGLDRHIRVEHWDNASAKARRPRRAMLGQDASSYDRLPYFFTDQYDLGMEYTGYIGPAGYDQVVFRRHADSQLIVFWLHEQRVLAGMNIDLWDVAKDIERLIQSGRPINTDDLADPDIPLASLLTRPAGLRSGSW